MPHHTSHMRTSLGSSPSENAAMTRSYRRRCCRPFKRDRCGTARDGGTASEIRGASSPSAGLGCAARCAAFIDSRSTSASSSMSRDVSTQTLSRSAAGHVDAAASTAVPGPEPKSSMLSGRKSGTRAESCSAGVSARMKLRLRRCAPRSTRGAARRKCTAAATPHTLPPASALQRCSATPAQAMQSQTHLAAAVGRRRDRARRWLLSEAHVAQQLRQAFVLQLLRANVSAHTWRRRRTSRTCGAKAVPPAAFVRECARKCSSSRLLLCLSCRPLWPAPPVTQSAIPCCSASAQRRTPRTPRVSQQRHAPAPICTKTHLAARSAAGAAPQAPSKRERSLRRQRLAARAALAPDQGPQLAPRARFPSQAALLERGTPLGVQAHCALRALRCVPACSAA